MFDAQLLKVTSAGNYVLGPWMERGGDNGMFAIDVIAISLAGGFPIRISLDTKASEDAGNGTATGGLSLEVTATGRTPGTQTGGMKELVRYRYSFNIKAGSEDWILFRMLQPSWYDTVKA